MEWFYCINHISIVEIIFLYSFTNGNDSIRSVKYNDRTNRPMIKDKILSEKIKR